VGGRACARPHENRQRRTHTSEGESRAKIMNERVTSSDRSGRRENGFSRGLKNLRRDIGWRGRRAWSAFIPTVGVSFMRYQLYPLTQSVGAGKGRGGGLSGDVNVDMLKKTEEL
jgi:hypothetical protein